MCMGFSLRPRNAVLSSPALAVRGPASPMMKRSSRRSIRSPLILKRISISTSFLHLRDDKCHQGQTREMDAADPPVETERAPDVLEARRFAQADPGVFDRHARIGAWATKPQAEGAGKCRLGPAGIGG